MNKLIKFTNNAEVVKLVDAHGSGPCGRTLMWVRVPPSARIAHRVFILL